MDRNQKKEFWQNHIDECSKSSLSQIDYCTVHKIPLSTFSYWKRKLKNGENKPIFYPLAISPKQSSFQEPKDSGLVLNFQDGRFTIEIEKGFSPSTLSNLIATLDQL